MSKTIELTKGQVAIVDDNDFEWLNQWEWYAKYYSKRNCYYAVRTISHSGSRKQLMARQIMGVTESKIMVDHADHNTLNNQRYNLRTCTNKENQWNKQKQSNNKSGYKGVYWDKERLKWCTDIRKDGKTNHLGRFENKIDAILAYNDMAIKLFGKFACINDL